MSAIRKFIRRQTARKNVSTAGNDNEWPRQWEEEEDSRPTQCVLIETILEQEDKIDQLDKLCRQTQSFLVNHCYEYSKNLVGMVLTMRRYLELNEERNQAIARADQLRILLCRVEDSCFDASDEDSESADSEDALRAQVERILCDKPASSNDVAQKSHDELLREAYMMCHKLRPSSASEGHSALPQRRVEAPRAA